MTPKRSFAAKLGPDESKLYGLIWNRFVACQMPPAEFDQTTATIVAPTKGRATRCFAPVAASWSSTGS